MDLAKLIDEESIKLDSHKLREFHNKAKLKEDINGVVETFIDENKLGNDYESITIIYRLADSIKSLF